MESPLIDSVAKFFYLSSLDENLSFSISLKVLSELRSRNRMGEDSRGHWIAAMAKWRTKMKSIRARPWSAGVHEKGFTLPPSFDLNAWTSFLKSADSSESEAVILSRVLGFTDDEIAEGLGVTAGTVRHRVGHGLRRLGGFIDA